MSLRVGAIEPPESLRFSGVHRFTARAVAIAVAVVVAIAIGIGLVQPLTFPLVMGLACAVLVGMIVARARDGATRVRHNERLEAELRETIQELRESRARVAHAADTERRRIERDLHDGCQQRLVAMRVKLSLAEEIVAGENRSVGELIREIASDAETALTDLHSLVHGIYPTLLTDRGLAEAIKAMARAAPVRVRVLAQGVRRYHADVEAAVYFTCAEALQNAVKHGGPDVEVEILLQQVPEGLAFRVRDRGCGFDRAVHAGSGLTNMDDRLGAIGGRFKVVSAPECGTAVQGWVPEATLVS